MVERFVLITVNETQDDNIVKTITYLKHKNNLK